MVSKVQSRMPRIMRNPHFWIVLALFAAGAIFHHAEQIGFLTYEESSTHFGLTRHAVDRVLFLIPITYAGFIFGITGGLISLAVALTIMLPRVIFVSPSWGDALLETLGVILVGGLVNMWFEGYQRERKRRQQTLMKLEAAQQELQSHVQAIENSEKRLAALNAVSDIIAQSLELQAVLELAASKVMEVMDVEVCLIFLLDEQAQELVLELYRGVSEEFSAEIKKMRVGEGFNGRVAQSGEPMVVEDASYDPRLSREVVKQEGIRAQLIVPVVAKGKVVGTLCMATRRSKQFAAEEVELLSAIGSEIGIAIENARLYQNEQLIAEQLRISEKKYRELFESAHDAIVVQDLKGDVIMTNRAFASLTGYAQEELIGMNVTSFLPEAGLKLARETKRKLLQGEVTNEPFEQYLIKKDGTEAILKLTTSPIVSDGRIAGFQHIARDITEEKRMEENLRFYLRQVTRAQEEERKRIARELHDDTAQGLVALSRRLDDLVSTSEHLSPRDIEFLEELREQTNRILEGVRRFSQDLRPSILDDLGLLPALEWLTSDLSQHFGIALATAVVGPERRFSPEAELLLFRIAQEALRNVWRHSGATRAWVTAEFGEGKATLTIVDNGKGFELPKRLGDLATDGKLGLAGMQERAQLLGGSFSLQSEPGKGTVVTVEVPI